MRTYKDILGKPSAAVRAMIEGLKDYGNRKDFVVDMKSYGGSIDGTCFGCAATCACQKASGVDYNSKNINSEWDRSLVSDVSMADQYCFEACIDELRCGCPQGLMVYFNLPYCRDHGDIIAGCRMDSENWRDMLPNYEQLADALEADGI